MPDQPVPPDDGYFVARETGAGTPRLRPWVVLSCVAAGAAALLLVGLVAAGPADPPLRAVAGAAGATDPQVVEPYDGPGSFRIWVTNDDGSAVRWDPCTPIPWVLYEPGAPPHALTDVQTAFDRLSARTGLDFVFEGFTDEQPSKARQPYQPDRWGDRWAPVLVGWVPTGTGALDLDANDRAVTVPVSVDAGDGGVFVTGQVVFNADRTLSPGFITRQSHWGGTILHELGHLVGLDHVDDEAELMYPRPGLGPPDFGPGDRAGLERLGADLGCVAQPEAQPVEVEFAD
ncbi:MAG TPA: hypothetical protein VGA69_11215 [Nitriliruptorales bacterium]